MFTIQLPAGPVNGVEKHGVRSFRNIPYAACQRFKRPTELESWLVPSDHVAAQCPQPDLRLEMLLWNRVQLLAFAVSNFVFGHGFNDQPKNPKPLPPRGDSQHMSEDFCLNLNVFTPSTATTAAVAALPVIVFVHGGSFIQGSGGALLYSSDWGSRLALRENVVLVTINYRLGAFGFLNVPGGDTNCGLHDVLAALRWVQRNIGALGGDADNVTLCGQSAGAIITGTLQASPLSRTPRPLFRRAIQLSGTGVCAISLKQSRQVSMVVVV